MEDRAEGDYEIITATSREDAEIDILQARHFVEAVSTWLLDGDWL